MAKFTLFVLSVIVLCGGIFAQSSSAAKAGQPAKTKAAASQDCCAETGKAAQSAKAASAQDCCEEGAAKTSKQGEDACCKSTEAKPMKKGDPGCCNAKGAQAKFKVYVSGIGYKFFGCEESAAKERKALLEKGAKVGAVQKVTSKVKIA